MLKGYLLKRKHAGVDCTCKDPITKEILNSDCPLCLGTGFTLGYYKDPAPATLIFTEPISSVPIHDIKGKLGTLTQTTARAKMSGLPPVNPYDVWVQHETNRRFYITAVKVSAEISGLPLQYDVLIKLANHTDVIYSYNV